MNTLSPIVHPAGTDSLAAVRDWIGTGGRKVVNFTLGMAILLALWWLGIWFITRDPTMTYFGDFAPQRAILDGIPAMWHYGTLQTGLKASGYRLGMGIALAIAIGVPIGIFIGRSKLFGDVTHLPFQMMRMVSPLAWEPIAVIAFAEWNHAIVFLITIGAVWPVMFATAAGMAKIDPAWFKVGRNLGAKPHHMLSKVILPAVAFDVLTGIRLALGVAWIVLIPAEFFGTKSGIGYTLENARENLAYDELMGMIVVIGLIGYILDSILVYLLNRANWVHES